MKQMNQTPYADIAAVNEPHMAVLLLLDTSGSMNGKPLEELMEGYNQFLKQTAMDDLAMKRVDIATMQFGNGVRIVQDFIPLSKAVEMPAPSLTADGQTPMGEAIEKGVQMVRDRCRVYDEAGIPHYKPWIFMITDGEPSFFLLAALFSVFLCLFRTKFSADKYYYNIFPIKTKHDFSIHLRLFVQALFFKYIDTKQFL